MKCRCGQVATRRCVLCGEELCFWHETHRTERVASADGATTLAVQQTICFPSCTSSFGAPELTPPRPRAKA